MNDKFKCDPNEIALKSFFLGPQAENGPWVSAQMLQMLERWFGWRRSLFPQDGKAISDIDQDTPEFIQKRQLFADALNLIMQRFEREVPKFCPRYIGHMFSEISLPALLGHFVALLHNPNNVSAEGSKVGVEIEEEAIGALLAMMGIDPTTGTGHFTSGGTVANFEALIRARARMATWLAASAATGNGRIFDGALSGWDSYDRNLSSLSPDQKERLKEFNFIECNPWSVARNLQRVLGVPFEGPVILVPESKHYSWKKGISLLGLGQESLWAVALDSRGKLSITDFKEQIEKARLQGRPIMMVVSVAGTTELGGFDPIHDVQETLDRLRDEQGIHIWHHIDAAYGGFFRALDLDDSTLLSPHLRRDLRAMERADSITLDPHKLGYVPYACGAFLAKSRRDYRMSAFGAPYVDFSGNLDRGSFTLEGSRSATGAAATWMIARSVGLNPQGYGRILSRSIRMKNELQDRLIEKLPAAGIPIRICPYGDSNILCFAIAAHGEELSKANARALKLYAKFSPSGSGPFFVSKTHLRWEEHGKFLDGWLPTWDARVDDKELVLVRMTLMNPFFGSRETSVNYTGEFILAIQNALEEALEAGD